VLPEAVAVRRVLAICCITACVVMLRLIPTPPPARADVCGTFPVSVACGVANGIASTVSSVVDVGGKAAKLTVNTGSGAISLGGKVVGKLVNSGGQVLCNWVAEGWQKKLLCGPAKSLLAKALAAAGKVKSKLPSGAAGSAAQVGAGGAITLAGLTGWVGAGAVWVLHKAGSVIGSTTEPNVHAPFFEREYRRMTWLAVLLALPMLLLAVIEGLLRSNWEILVRALVAVPTAFLITAMAVVLVGIGVTLSDLMGQAVAAGAQDDAKRFFDHAAIVLGVLLAVGGAASHVLAGHAPGSAHVIKGAPLFLVAVGSLYAFLAAGLVLLELFMREVGIFATLLFVPIVMAARIWPRLSHWGRELAQGLVALILSKFVIVAILAFAASAGSSWHPTVLLLAFALLTVAAVSPAMLFGIVRFAEHSWQQRGSSRAMVVQSVSAAEQMRRTFMTHNPGHRIDPPGRTAPAAESPERAAGSEAPGARGRARPRPAARSARCGGRWRRRRAGSFGQPRRRRVWSGFLRRRCAAGVDVRGLGGSCRTERRAAWWRSAAAACRLGRRRGRGPEAAELWAATTDRQRIAEGGLAAQCVTCSVRLSGTRCSVTSAPGSG
jgi:hypothetical protein